MITSVSKKLGQCTVVIHYCVLSQFFWNRRYYFILSSQPPKKSNKYFFLSLSMFVRFQKTRNHLNVLIFLALSVASYMAYWLAMRSRVGKSGSLGPWSKVIVYSASFPFAKMIVPLGDHFRKRTVCYNTQWLCSKAPKILFCQP